MVDYSATKQESDSVRRTQELKTQIYANGNSDKKVTILNVHKKIMELLLKDKPKFRKLIKLAYAVRKGLKEDYDWVSALTGREGRGKSTLLIILLAIIDIQFHMEKNLSLLPSTGEVIRKFRKIRRFGGLGIDEAIKALHKQDWYLDVQKEIIREYATERFKNKATILAIPRFKDLNENFRNHRINCWLHVHERGLAFCYVPIDIPFFPDPWFMSEMEKKYTTLLKRKRGVNITIEDVLKVERDNPCFVDVIEFPDLPDDIKEVYLTLKIDARTQEEKNGLLDSVVDKDKVRKAMSIQIVKLRESGKKRKEIAEEYDLTESMIKILSKEGRIHIRKKFSLENKKLEGEWEAPS
jgi:hypothetical protein